MCRGRSWLRTPPEHTRMLLASTGARNTRAGKNDHANRNVYPYKTPTHERISERSQCKYATLYVQNAYVWAFCVWVCTIARSGWVCAWALGRGFW